nr:hypothetical protein [uncultured Moellerella sp.]
MKISSLSSILLFVFLPLSSANAATPEQCYSYLTELVRSSQFPFAEWNIKPQDVNLLIDEDDDSKIRAKLFIDTDGTGTIGWVVYNKDTGELYNITNDPDNPIKLKFNTEYAKAQQYCLSGDPIYQVNHNGRLYLFDKKQNGFQKSKFFIIKGDYVQVLENDDSYSHIIYHTKLGNTVEGWVDTNTLRQIDFINTW